MFEIVLNCCCVCYDPEIEVKVMSTETTSVNTGFTAFFSRLFCLFADDTCKIHCFNPRKKDSHMKGAGMLVVSLRVYILGSLGVFCAKRHYFSHEGLVEGCT